jgi:hypothetical protein
VTSATPPWYRQMAGNRGGRQIRTSPTSRNASHAWSARTASAAVRRPLAKKLRVGSGSRPGDWQIIADAFRSPRKTWTEPAVPQPQRPTDRGFDVISGAAHRWMQKQILALFEKGTKGIPKGKRSIGLVAFGVRCKELPYQNDAPKNAPSRNPLEPTQSQTQAHISPPHLYFTCSSQARPYSKP